MVPGRDIPLRPLLTFGTVARHVSFREAARALHLTAGAVSRQMRQLEEFFGKPLFVRSREGVRVTPFGRALLPTVEHALRSLAESAARIQTGRSVVRVSLLPVFAVQWLAPRLAALHGSFGEIALEYRFDGALADLHAGRCDLAIRGLSGKPDFDANVRAVPLLRSSFVAVCAPELLPQQQPLATLEQLCHYDWLENRDFRAWAQCRSVCSELPDNPRVTWVPDHVLALEAARTGQGICICNDDLVTGDIERGLLIRASEHRFQLDANVYAVCLASALQRPEVVRVLDWFTSQSPLGQ